MGASGMTQDNRRRAPTCAYALTYAVEKGDEDTHNEEDLSDHRRQGEAQAYE